MCVCFQLHTSIQPEILIYSKEIWGGKKTANPPHIHSGMAQPASPGKYKENNTVLTRACSSNNSNRLPTLNVQVQPIKNKGSIVSVSHLIVSECYLPTAGPVMGTSLHFEGVSGFRNTGLESRITNDRLIIIHLFIHLINSFIPTIRGPGVHGGELDQEIHSRSRTPMGKSDKKQEMKSEIKTIKHKIT